jgi:hypothetical protein
MANHRYSANHKVGPDTARPSPGSGSGSKGTVKEGSANWPRNIGAAGPAINKTGFKEVKAYPVSRMNDDPVDPSIYEGAAMTAGMIPGVSAISPIEMSGTPGMPAFSPRQMRQNRRAGKVC